MRPLLLTLLLTLPAHAYEAGIALRPGALGLFNLNREFTPADPSLGIVPSFTTALSPRVSLGLVCALSWVRSEVGTRHRLLVDPALRARGRLPISGGFDGEAVLDLGAAFWPKDPSEAALHSALNADRWGWSVHVGAGVAYRWSSHAAFAHLGYAASTSYGEGLSATADHGLLSFGMRQRF